jgi:hypothetical protein
LRNTGANLVKTTAEPQKEDAPRARILATARKLFYRRGIRLIPSSGRQRGGYVRGRFEKFYPGDPLAPLRAWLREMAAHVADSGERGCPLINAAVELPE